MSSVLFLKHYHLITLCVYAKPLHDGMQHGTTSSTVKRPDVLAVVLYVSV